MKAILHIGGPKTGSSAIQQTLRANEAALGRQGILLHAPNETAGSGRLADLYRAGATGPDGHPGAAAIASEQAWQSLQARLAREQPRAAILSSEYFFRLPRAADFLTRLQGLFSSIHVIGYVRDPVALYPSSIDQTVRNGGRAQDIVTPAQFPFRAMQTNGIKVYRDRLPDGALIVRNFDRTNLVNGDVVEDFRHFAGRALGQAITFDTEAIHANQSLSGAATVWLMHLNSTLPDNAPRAVKLRKALVRQFRDSDALRSLPRLKLTDPDLIAMIRQNARETCAWYNREMLTDQVPLPVGGGTGSLPGRRIVREKTMGWLESYLDDAARRRIFHIAAPVLAKMGDA